MRPIVPLTVGSAAAAAGMCAFPPGTREAALAAIGAGYLAVVSWGTWSMRSGIFGKAVVRGRRDRPEVALTFDDGPDPRSTPPLLDLLAAREAPAAFFCVGRKVAAHPGVVRRCAAEGHLVGNHSHRHSVFHNFLFAGPMRRELEACQEEIGRVLGARPVWYRPPYGLMNHAVDGVARALGLRLVGWEAGSADPPGMLNSMKAPRSAARVLRRVKPGGIILIHDGGRDPAWVVETVTRILDGLAARQLKVVPLDKLAG